MELEIIPLKLEEEGDESYLIYRPLVHLAFVGNRAMAELTQRVCEDPVQFAGQVQSESVAFLARSGFFVPDPEIPKQNPPPPTAVLLLTNRCQLRCVYCYAAAGEYAPRQLKVTTGKAAIDHACGEARQKNQPLFQVDFHGGGEPTLEWKILQELTEYARGQSVPSKISITSNAIWSEAQCEWLAQNMDEISISMDGSISTQDRQRPFVNGHPSSSIVMRNLRILDERHVQYGIRLTACPPWEQLVENIRFIVENTACRNMQVEPAFNDQRGEHRQPGQDEERAFVQAFIDAYELSLDHQASFYYSGARPEVVTRVFCSAPFHALIVNPDDEVVACYEIVSNLHPLADIATFGRVADGRIEIDQSRRQRLHNLLAERLETCHSCFCHWNCAGDCFTRSFGVGDQAHLAKSKRCDLNRDLTLHMLLSLIERQGGVWHEQVDMDSEKYG
ncbi:MAG TPA: radical SAM protein [Anaerolineales bacterium]|nr:radical SAM protein [Anaerolineales bacterium]